MAVDLEPVKQVMYGNMGKIVLLGAILIVGICYLKNLGGT